MHFRQAIVTKFLGPTNSRGSRVVASAEAGRITVSWDHALGIDENHAAAAQAFATKLGWHGAWVAGGMPGGSGYCFVLCDAPPFDDVGRAFTVERKPGT